MKIAIFGATGKTGNIVMKLALDEGHSVRALARDPSKVTIKNEHLEIVQGDVLDSAAVENTLRGSNAVISALGSNTLGPTTLVSKGTANIGEAMKRLGLKRIVTVGSSGMLGEIGGIPGLIVGFILRNPLKDHRRQYDYLVSSGLDWTILRPLSLTDVPATRKCRITETGVPKGARSVSRADVASFLLDCVVKNEWIGKCPAIAN